MKSTKSTIMRHRKQRRQTIHRTLSGPLTRFPYSLCCLLLIVGFVIAPVIADASKVPSSVRIAMLVSEDMELYPLRLVERDAVSILDLVYESVMEIDDNRDPVPLLAESFDVLNEGNTYVFHLRENVYFHDGTQLTAHDVCATMDAIKAIAEDSSLLPNEKGLYCSLLDYVRRWSAEDQLTLRIEAKAPSYCVLYAMTFPVLQAQSLYMSNPPGTGPYRIDYYSPGAEIWLSGNEGWWRQPPFITEIVAIWYADVDKALSAFEAEQVDIVMTRSPTAARYRGTISSRVNSYGFSTRQLECLFMMNARLLSEPELRKAIAYGINEERLMINVYQNVVTDTDTIQSRRSWLYNPPPQSQTYSYSPEKACEILDRLGWAEIGADGYRIKRNADGDEQQLMFRLNYYEESGNALRKDAANEIATMLRSIGIRIKISALSFEDAQNNLANRNFDLLLGAINFDIVPDPAFLLVDRSKCNFVNYRSDEIASLCKELMKASRKDDFQLIWAQIQDQFSKDMPFIPMYYRDGVVLTRYPYSNVRDIREFELLKGLERYR